MGAHKDTSGRAKTGLGSVEAVRERVQVKCEKCGALWSFYRFKKQPRPEYRVCSDCAIKTFVREQRGTDT